MDDDQSVVVEPAPRKPEQPPAHAQKTDQLGESELQFRPSALLDDPALVGRKLEEHLDLEGGYFARQLSQTDNCRVPTVDRTLPMAARSTSENRNQQFVEYAAGISIDA